MVVDVVVSGAILNQLRADGGRVNRRKVAGLIVANCLRA